MITKRLLLVLFLLPLTKVVQAQTASVERSIYGVQAGLVGFWGYNESRLSNTIALRTEVGLNGGIWQNDLYNTSGIILFPELSLEPRWYYNIRKRTRRLKRTAMNSANFVTLKAFHHPDWFTVGAGSGVTVIPDIGLVPMWGIRRNVGSQFNFEAGIGIGYQYLLYKSAGYTENSGDTIGFISLRFGYHIK
ncbi:hypothetical protein DN752_03600 [Echinicola strongylocentroti]|uniref:Outer membrane protein beta-barrel domain-containing protein n=1 Tax=Echinicola strongylocentroti TaxID=1795355 RepID=A0A2Z4IEV8_9BACT|nr:hypothetical protein [Echinicola strongylocentroti]AWW29299.1 hypothetical protein DN752_03600 [Echinicola strongylocentroti]